MNLFYTAFILVLGIICLALSVFHKNHHDDTAAGKWFVRHWKH